jgi:hypothetical protein
MEILSKTYGWTPNQIKETSMVDILQYLDIIKMRNKLEEAEHKKIKR